MARSNSLRYAVLAAVCILLALLFLVLRVHVSPSASAGQESGIHGQRASVPLEFSLITIVLGGTALLSRHFMPSKTVHAFTRRVAIFPETASLPVLTLRC